MLMYHPAQDVNHCIYRILLILECSVHDKYNVDVYRLVDFYVLFPSLLKLIKPLPKPISKHKSKFAKINDSFESLINTPRIFSELETLQSVAIKNLLAKKFLDKQAFCRGILQRTNKPLPESFSSEIRSARLPNEEWFKALINEFPNAKFIGKNGLKSRTGLMEYRYDMESK